MSHLYNYENTLKSKILSGDVCIGAFLLSASPFIAEIMANFALDWILIDAEASHASKKDILHILQALNGYKTVPLIRISSHEVHLIESNLDFGARGIMVPKVNNVNEAKTVSEACFYPPKGNRGINCIRASGYYTRAKQYFDAANDANLCIVQIESKESIFNLDEIAQVPNVDVLFIGLGDLAASYGQLGDVSGQHMDEARSKVIDVCKKYHKIPGIFAHSMEVAKQYVNEGFKFIAIGNDVKFLMHGMSEAFKKLK